MSDAAVAEAADAEPAAFAKSEGAVAEPDCQIVTP